MLISSMKLWSAHFRLFKCYGFFYGIAVISFLAHCSYIGFFCYFKHFWSSAFHLRSWRCYLTTPSIGVIDGENTRFRPRVQATETFGNTPEMWCVSVCELCCVVCVILNFVRTAANAFLKSVHRSWLLSCFYSTSVCFKTRYHHSCTVCYNVAV